MTAGEGPFLGVARSLTGRAWAARPAAPDLVRRHQAALGLSEPLARALASRGVGPDDGEAYLNPTLKILFPDPSSFRDMDLAAEILVDALVRERPMVVFADYDVDGAASAAQLVRWMRAMGREVPVYIPDRVTEGYGPNPAVFRSLKEKGAELVITLDCGAAAVDALAAARDIGLDVVVIDHHLMRPGEVPAAAALVNPNRPDDNSGQGMLAAAGVAFVLLAALNREARLRGLFADRAEPDIRQWLDLAALGAVCDVTALTGFNRALTAQGLKVMSRWANPGLKALADIGKVSGPATTFHAGFILGPRINAGGRIGRSDLGARLLATDDPDEAAILAAQLDELNGQRKAVEQAVLDEAVALIETDPARIEAPVLVVAAPAWPPGVIGIVAGRLRERYRRPAVVIGVDVAAGIGKGSGRSQSGVNLGAAVQAAFEAGILLSGGGHAMAAGLSIRPDRIADFTTFLADQLGEVQARAAEADALEIDALVTPRGADRSLLDAFKRLAPFGPGNPEPVFAVASARIERPIPMRGGHVRVTLSDSAGGRLKAVAWRAEETPLGQALLAGGVLHLAGRLRPDDWQGRASVELEIEDAADPRRADPS
ncbi:MAG: single-stranded-DNA-specific exonuclease RecJ [Phenylobacterium sp.]